MLTGRITGAAALGLTMAMTTACSEVTPMQPQDLTMQAVRAPAMAGANQRATVLRANLDELNGSGADGQVTIVARDGRLMVTLNARGLSPNLPHAQHIHIGGTNMCPTQAMDGNSDGLLSSIEGAPAYGGVRVSLTTEGDVSAASGLAVPRFPVANRAGVVTYRRSFELPAGVSVMDVMNGVVVVHGISELFDDPSAYDGEPRSSLNPSLPLEATIPALCGKLMAPGSK